MADVRVIVRYLALLLYLLSARRVDGRGTNMAIKAYSRIGNDDIYLRKLYNRNQQQYLNDEYYGIYYRCISGQ